jgi:cation diffusion facilitator family transporter
MDRTARYAMLTVGVALLTLTLKSLAAYVTGSVGLMSDALESILNLATSLMLVFVLRIAKLPPDPDHHYGHDKAEYFANGVQGTLILLAAGGIFAAATERFLNPRMLEEGLLGLGLAALAGLINLITARFLHQRSLELRSNALKGEASHLMSDVWTSVAVILGVGLDFWTGLTWLDPLAATAVSLFVLSTGLRLLKDFVAGLMDTSLPDEHHKKVLEVLDAYKDKRGIDFHALRSRVSGSRTFVSVHILVPGAWSVKTGHELLDELESDLSKVVNGVTVLTHLEPLEEECSFNDIELG